MATTTKMSFKGVAMPKTGQRLAPTISQTRTRIVCESRPIEKATAAVLTAAPALFLANPVFAKVTNNLVSEGTGKIFGITDAAEGWAIIIVFGIVWAFYAVSAKDLGGGENDDSGLSL